MDPKDKTSESSKGTTSKEYIFTPPSSPKPKQSSQYVSSSRKNRRELLKNLVMSPTSKTTSLDVESVSKSSYQDPGSAKNVTELTTLKSQKPTKSLNSLKATEKAKTLLSALEGSQPKAITELTERFINVDVILRTFKHRTAKITEVDQSLRLTYKRDFDESHVCKISYIYEYAPKKTKVEETEEPSDHAYVLGRTEPKSVQEKSILTLKLPPAPQADPNVSISSELNSSNPLIEKLFAYNNPVTERANKFKMNIQLFLDDKHNEFLKEHHYTKPTVTKYHIRFDILPYLNEIQYPLPKPLRFKPKSVKDFLAIDPTKESESTTKKEIVTDIDEKDIPAYLKGLPKSLILDVLNRQNQSKSAPTLKQIKHFDTDLRQHSF